MHAAAARGAAGSPSRAGAERTRCAPPVAGSRPRRRAARPLRREDDRGGGAAARADDAHAEPAPREPRAREPIGQISRRSAGSASSGAASRTSLVQPRWTQATRGPSVPKRAAVENSSPRSMTAGGPPSSGRRRGRVGVRVVAGRKALKTTRPRRRRGRARAAQPQRRGRRRPGRDDVQIRSLARAVSARHDLRGDHRPVALAAQRDVQRAAREPDPAVRCGAVEVDSSASARSPFRPASTPIASVRPASARARTGFPAGRCASRSRRPPGPARPARQPRDRCSRHGRRGRAYSAGGPARLRRSSAPAAGTAR